MSVEFGQEKEEDEQVARDYFEKYLRRRWRRSKEEVELYKALENVSRLRKLYPGLFEDVLEELLRKSNVENEEKNGPDSSGTIDEH